MTSKIKLASALFGGIALGAVMFTATGVSAHDGGIKGDYSKEQWQELSDEERTELKEQKMLQRQQEREANLQSKVDDGTLTADQQAAILDWMSEKTEEKSANSEDRISKEDFQALTDDERAALKEDKTAERETRKAEAQKFFESIGVDKEDLFDGEGHGKRGQKGNSAQHTEEA